MTRLVGIELRRIFARRFLHLIVLAAIVGGAIAGIVLVVRTNADFSVDDIVGTLQATTVPLVLAAWLLGATFIGAEWRAGSLTTLLTWEPRRIRVHVSKAATAAIAASILTAALQCVIAGMLLPGAFKHGASGIDSEWLRTAGGVIGRGTALAAMAALVGLSLASIGRNTAFGLGVGFVYLAILEGGLLGSIFPGIRRWLVVGNSIVLVTGREDFDIAGRSVLGAALVLSLYAIGALLVATAIFRARDVT